MEANVTRQGVLFQGLFDRPLNAVFDLPDSSSDGGAILLRAADKRLGLLESLSGRLVDQRQPGKVRHDLHELLCQRVHGLACGYPDGNDAARLKADPVHRLLVGLPPCGEDMLASQATLSRFENSVSPLDLYRMGVDLCESVIARHRRRVGRRCRRINVDLDVTDDATHGAQQLSFFNGFYGSHCYLPLLGFISFDKEPDQYLCAALLRSGNAPTQRGVLGLLRRLLPRLRAAFPRARILVRLDGGFACPELFDLLDAEKRVDYVVGMAKNKRVLGLCRGVMRSVRAQARREHETRKRYGAGLYQAGKWSAPRRLVWKAEVVCLEDRKPKDNPRFLVTNLRGSPRHVYEVVYCKRGEIENRIKELKYGLAIDRTSCTRFFANQLRVLLTAAAYALLQELRLAAAGTALARAQVSTMRERLLKIGVLVSYTVRRLLFRMPETFAYRDEWCLIARKLGARPG